MKDPYMFIVKELIYELMHTHSSRFKTSDTVEGAHPHLKPLILTSSAAVSSRTINDNYVLEIKQPGYVIVAVFKTPLNCHDNPILPDVSVMYVFATSEAVLTHEEMFPYLPSEYLPLDTSRPVSSDAHLFSYCESETISLLTKRVIREFNWEHSAIKIPKGYKVSFSYAPQGATTIEPYRLTFRPLA